MKLYDVRDTRLVERFTWYAFLIVAIGAVLIIGSALLDVVFGLGWGYTWKDVLLGTLIAAGGVAVYAMCRAFFRLMGVRD